MMIQATDPRNWFVPGMLDGTAPSCSGGDTPRAEEPDEAAAIECWIAEGNPNLG
jgi:hypothetical protein